MAVGLDKLPELHPVDGIRLGTTCAGISQPDRRDLVVIELAEGAHTAAVFTRNAFCAAPVIVARQHLNKKMPRMLVINTGNANAGTGASGILDAASVCDSLSRLAGCQSDEILPFSTGVIGEALPISEINAALSKAYDDLNPAGWIDAASGIMTTDTVPKGVSCQFELKGRTVTLTGIVKGAGMIRPDMATMLAFITTDAAVSSSVLQTALSSAVIKSFNRITVDGDTSTNDACLLMATGKCSGAVIDTLDDEDYSIFLDKVTEVCKLLAQAIVRDGEGATKFVTIKVNGAESATMCDQVAYNIAHSPLVKTALFASDPNWGRILAVVGRSGIPVDAIEQVSIFLDNVCIVRNGGKADDYQEAQGQKVMQQDELCIRVDLGQGDRSTEIWTTDLSYDYVKINAEYRT